MNRLDPLVGKKIDLIKAFELYNINFDGINHKQVIADQIR